ncbi:MAG: S-adenosylmethionine decarboxylase [Patescibacteria group bacterium]|nr:S-adenosylmethionine decarboxylase [Patescibacteria group bacterium]MCL5261847.1 S-adenosylmethionine decarboxylase [Patescibacteria group bacterium]
MSDEQIVKKYQAENPWGMSTTVDLKDCNPETIRSADKIKQFVVELCELIDMKRFGETTVVDFGDNPRVSGFSMTQLIETSLISGHFANQTNAAYLDIFSCKAYAPEKAAEFAKNFFEAKTMEFGVTFRK